MKYIIHIYIYLESEIDLKLEKAIVIFQYISDKDIFENFYKNLLCKRLLSGKILSDEVEKLAISKFKTECGYQYTSRLEGMFVDINTSKSVMEQFKKSNLYAQSPVELVLYKFVFNHFGYIRQDLSHDLSACIYYYIICVLNSSVQ